MKKYKINLRLVIQTCFTFLIIIASFNFVVDPSHIFSPDFEYKLANIIGSNQNAANVDNYNELFFQKIFISQYKPASEVVVLGSSRSKLVRDYHFPQNDFFNSSIAGADLEDIYKIYELYDNAGLKPKKVIINIDPWMFNISQKTKKKVGLKRVTISPLEKVKDSTANFRNQIRKYLTLIDARYLQRSFKVLESSNWSISKIDIYATSATKSSTPIKLHDGSFSYPISQEKLSPEEANRSATKYINRDLPRTVGGSMRVDENAKLEFEKFLSHLQSQDVQVTILLTPYHPMVYQHIKSQEKYQKVLDIENYLIRLSQGLPITLIGSYSPYKLNCRVSQFYDGIHAKQECIDKILLSY